MRRSESASGAFSMNGSALMRQDAETAGKSAHLFPSPKRDDPSRRSTPVRKYLSARPKLARVKNETRRLFSADENGVTSVAPPPRLLKLNASVRKFRPSAPNSSVS